MQQRETKIVNKLGLHARASAKLTQLAGSFKCEGLGISLFEAIDSSDPTGHRSTTFPAHGWSSCRCGWIPM